MSEAARRVLIVDDDPDYRAHLHQIIGNAACAREPKEGLKLLADDDFAVILLDQWYRNTSLAGTDVVAEYRRRARAAVVVVMSMDYDPAVAADAAGAGADFYVDKYGDEAILSVLYDAHLLAAARRQTLISLAASEIPTEPPPRPRRH